MEFVRDAAAGLTAKLGHKAFFLNAPAASSPATVSLLLLSRLLNGGTKCRALRALLTKRQVHFEFVFFSRDVTSKVTPPEFASSIDTCGFAQAILRDRKLTLERHLLQACVALTFERFDACAFIGTTASFVND